MAGNSELEQQLRDWMNEVLAVGQQGVAQGQSPFAAAVYDSTGDRLACEFNRVARSGELSRHAEVVAIDQAVLASKKPHLKGCWLVASAEPCPMCAALAALAGINQIAFGAPSATVQRAGYQTLGMGCREFFAGTNRSPEIHGAILQEPCEQLLLDNPRS